MGKHIFWLILMSKLAIGPLWSWSYGSWINNHLCNLPITANAVSSNPAPAHGEMYSTQYYVIKFVSDLQQVGGFPTFLHQYNWPWQYNWNIIESAAKHHKSNQIKLLTWNIKDHG